MNKIAECVWQLAEPIVTKLGLKLWDVEYVKEAGRWFLRVYIDKEGGVSIDDCEAVSRALDPVLDEADPIPTSYTFEVSSAGAERALRRPGDFAAFAGHLVEVRLYKAIGGRKEYVGNLISGDDDHVAIDIGGTEHRFDRSAVASVRLRLSF